jgi:type IV secretion system protein VirB1
MDLLSLAILCGPLVDPAMTLRLIAIESGGAPYVIHDNTTRRSVDAGRAEKALSLAKSLINAGHRIDVGLMQINVDAWVKFSGLPIEKALDPCTNIRLGTTILSADYARALAASGNAQAALPIALSLYNSGSESNSLGYAKTVLREDSLGHRVHLNIRSTAERARTVGVEFPDDLTPR